MAEQENVYDVVVLGAGPVGQNVAARARAAGLTVVVVERELVGGECSYWACIPSKALLRPVAAVADARRVDGARAAVTGMIDSAAALERRDRFVAGWDDTYQAEQYVRGIGAELVRGHGRLDGAYRVVVVASDNHLVRLRARHAVAVCTGSSAVVPDLPGIAEAKPWTNRRATDSGEVPRRLVIVGGGPVGVEMATAWKGLGSSVTLLAREAFLLPRMEAFAGEIVEQGLKDAGVDVRTGVSATGLCRDGDGPVTVALSDGGRVEADEVLFATGRVPNTRDIGLDTVGLIPASWMEVDDTCRVSGVDGGWLYAAGDVNHRALLTHQGKYQARIVGNAIGVRAAGQMLDTEPWGEHVATADSSAVPQVVFSDPEVGSVGLSSAQAEAAGHRIRVVEVDLEQAVVGASLRADGYRGRARMIVDLDRECVLGVTLVGPGVAELLHSATIAIVAQVPLSRLWHAVPSFPTISEVWLRLLEAYRG